MGSPSDDSTIAGWIEVPAGKDYVRFGELPYLIADALWPGKGDTEEEDFVNGFRVEGARINLEAELKAAVEAGRLHVYDPLTRGPHSYPSGAALDRALVKIGDLASYVAGRGLGVRNTSKPKQEIRQARAHVWRLKPTAELWQCVALSLDIEPDEWLTTEAMDRAPRKALPAEFFDRLEVCHANVTYGGPIDARAGMGEHDTVRRTVRLAEVVAFLLSAGPPFSKVPEWLQSLERTASAKAEGASVTTPAVRAAVTSKPLTDDWKHLAVTKAKEIIREHRERNLYPSQANIADLVAKDFRARGINGADGKPLSGATIKRHALKGISSAVARQLSTAPRRGK